MQLQADSHEQQVWLFVILPAGFDNQNLAWLILQDCAGQECECMLYCTAAEQMQFLASCQLAWKWCDKLYEALTFSIRACVLPREPPDAGLMCECLWSDPAPEQGRQVRGCTGPVTDGTFQLHTTHRSMQLRAAAALVILLKTQTMRRQA